MIGAGHKHDGVFGTDNDTIGSQALELMPGTHRCL